MNNTHDPRTPLLGALAVWAQMPWARLLTAEADGHISLAFSPCASGARYRFLDDPAAAPKFASCAA
jgi:hypothetical protein